MIREDPGHQQDSQVGKQNLVGGIPTPLKNDGVRQWEGWHPIYEMENNKCLKSPTRNNSWNHSPNWDEITKNPYIHPLPSFNTSQPRAIGLSLPDENRPFLKPLSPIPMDWFKGKFTGKPHDLNGKIHGFRFRFSLKLIHWQQNFR